MNSFVNLLRAGLGFHKKNKFYQALEIYLKLLDEKKNDSKLLYLIGTCYLQISRPDIAISYLEKTIQLDKDNIAAYNNLGGAFFQINKFEKSLEIYQKILL